MAEIHSVILAAGLSTRMGSAHTNKVCLDLLGKPVICRTIEALENAAVKSHTAVVGACAGEVIECIVRSGFTNVSYAFQHGQRGPAEALYAAVRSLPQSMDPDTLLLIVPGHRIISRKVIDDLLQFYNANNCKFAGVELLDEQGNLRQKLSICLGKLSDIASGLEKFYLLYSPESTAEFTLDMLAEVINGSGNFMLQVRDFRQVMGFNNPEEFLQVAGLLRQQEGLTDPGTDKRFYQPVSQWLKALQENLLTKDLQKLYGGDGELVSRQQTKMIELVRSALEQWGADAEISIIRSPGRVNIMGRHVDHQGGNCNLMTIGYETLMASRIRQDDLVTLQNLDKEFAPAQFSIGELVRDLPWDDWQTLVGSKKLARLLKQYGVNWADYIKAVFLRFQKHFDHKKLHGMDMIVSGNVPMAAGLSSSSTLVVGAAEAVVGANRLDLENDKLVTLCGEGEWFVGTRGGAADHAAVKLGECNKVVKVGFFDFRIEKMVRFPEDYALIVCDSRIQARKSGKAKDQFNCQVSCYKIGLLLLKKFFPQYAHKLHHLRDFSCENLGIPLDWLYTLLCSLPGQASRRELEAMLPGEDLSGLWQSHAEPANKLYSIRGVVLYGLAECARSGRFVDCLSSDVEQAGLMMNISHNGDRVQKFDGNGNLLGDYFSDTSDAVLMKLAADLRGSDPAAREAAQLWRQPGSYRCSLPESELMTDLACSVPGVAGAQLAGAGLGGCMMVLARKDSVAELEKLLIRKYYEPRNLAAQMLLCRPISGAMALTFPQ